MKKYLKLNIAAICVSILLTGCSNESRSKLQKSVDEIEAKCPIKVDEGTTIDSVVYENDMVTYYSSSTNGLINVQTLKDETDLISNLVVNAIRSSDSPEISEQLQMCADAGATIVMAFTDRQGDTFDLRIDPAEYVQNNQKN